jgi:hypothetical protein
MPTPSARPRKTTLRRTAPVIDYDPCQNDECVVHHPLQWSTTTCASPRLEPYIVGITFAEASTKNAGEPVFA